MSNLSKIKSSLKAQAIQSGSQPAIFFKTGAGEYAAHDHFLGVPVPVIRKIARDYRELSLAELSSLLSSRYNEERLFALIILVHQYEQSQDEQIYQFYLDHRHQVNNWNLVDSSAPLIVGAHLFNRDKKILLSLAKSEVLWDRRIAIVATWYFIRQNQLEWTFKLAHTLIDDKQDLIHKAVGWMLREAGKRDEEELKKFLESHAQIMPRTMLRYAIEKFDEKQRKKYLAIKPIIS